MVTSATKPVNVATVAIAVDSVNTELTNMINVEGSDIGAAEMIFVRRVDIELAHMDVVTAVDSVNAELANTINVNSSDIGLVNVATVAIIVDSVNTELTNTITVEGSDIDAAELIVVHSVDIELAHMDVAIVLDSVNPELTNMITVNSSDIELVNMIVVDSVNTEPTNTLTVESSDIEHADMIVVHSLDIELGNVVVVYSSDIELTNMIVIYGLDIKLANIVLDIDMQLADSIVADRAVIINRAEPLVDIEPANAIAVNGPSTKTVTAAVAGVSSDASLGRVAVTELASAIVEDDAFTELASCTIFGDGADNIGLANMTVAGSAVIKVANATVAISMNTKLADAVTAAVRSVTRISEGSMTIEDYSATVTARIAKITAAMTIKDWLDAKFAIIMKSAARMKPAKDGAIAQLTTAMTAGITTRSEADH